MEQHEEEEKRIANLRFIALSSMCHFNKWENFSGTFRSTAEKKEEENDCLCVRVCLRLEIKKPVFN